MEPHSVQPVTGHTAAVVPQDSSPYDSIAILICVSKRMNLPSDTFLGK